MDHQNSGPAKLFWLENYGCQMNSAESRGIEEMLLTQGWQSAQGPEEAELIIVNSCSVRKSAEKRVLGRLALFRSLKKKSPKKIVLTGCMASRGDQEADQLQEEADFLVSNNDKYDFFRFLNDQSLDQEPGKGHQKSEYAFFQRYSRQSEFQAFVPIANGCNNYCAYCIVPYVRGPEISRSVESILDELLKLEAEGLREISLLGQNVNSYQTKYKGQLFSFTDLLDFILRKTENIKWLRFLSPHPKDFSDDLVQLVRKEERICKFVHLPLQSGSNRILKEMNRKYTREEYLDLMDRLRADKSGILFSTDIMVGFPGETEEDFDQTMDLVEKARYFDAFTYYYNRRPGTKAADMPKQVPLEIRMQRLEKLIQRQREIGAELRKEQLGSRELVLIEGRSKKNKDEWLGRSEKNQMCIFQSSLHKPGDFIKLKLAELRGNTFIGRI